MIPKELRKHLCTLNLPAGEYVIFGSGPMAIRNMRDARDLDILISPSLGDSLRATYPTALKYNPTRLEIEGIELYTTWPFVENECAAIIQSAETIDGLPYARLEYVLKWKQGQNRDKDKKDIALIKKYLKK